MNALDPELLARLAAADAERPVPAGAAITAASLRRHARRHTVRSLCLATAALSVLGLPLLFRGAPPMTALTTAHVDLSTQLRVLRARLATLQSRASQHLGAMATQDAQDADARRTRSQRFELAAVRADAALRHRQTTTVPGTRR